MLHLRFLGGANSFQNELAQTDHKITDLVPKQLFLNVDLHFASVCSAFVLRGFLYQPLEAPKGSCSWNTPKSMKPKVVRA